MEGADEFVRKRREIAMNTMTLKFERACNFDLLAWFSHCTVHNGNRH